MGWKTDWLFALIFREIQRIWNEANRFAEQISKPEKPQPSLEALRVRQCAGARLGSGFLSPPILREWLFDGADFTELEPTETFLPKRKGKALVPFPLSVRNSESRGALFVEGNVSFYITPGRKQCVLTYQLGPRYGRGIVYEVHGQGTGATLNAAIRWGS